MSDSGIPKRRCYQLDEPVDAAMLAEIKNKLEQQAGVKTVNTSQAKATVDYDLVQTNHITVKSFLKNLVTLKKETGLSRLISCLVCYCEKNELDHVTHAAGWDYYTQNLYLSLSKNHYD